MFNNNVVAVIYMTSFGHNILNFDYISRVFFPYKVSIVYIRSLRSNPMLIECFKKNLEFFIFDSFIFKISYKNKVFARRCRIVERILNRWLHLIRAITGNFQIVEHNIFTHKTLSMTKDRQLFYGIEEEERKAEYIDYTGYLRVIQRKIGASPKLPNNLVNEAESIIFSKYPNFQCHNFITLFLRKKGSEKFDDINRSAGPHKNYRKAVGLLSEEGYSIAGCGETDCQQFDEEANIYDFTNKNSLFTKYERDLLNLYLLTKAKLFIGQHSGPQHLCVSRGIPVLLTDTMPFYHGTMNSEDIILRKKLYSRKEENFLNLIDIYIKNTDLAFGYNYEKNNVYIVPNSSEEIYEAVSEVVLLINKKLFLTETQRKLISHFKQLPFDNRLLYSYQLNRPPLFILEKMKDELFEYFNENNDS